MVSQWQSLSGLSASEIMRRSVQSHGKQILPFVQISCCRFYSLLFFRDVSSFGRQIAYIRNANSSLRTAKGCPVMQAGGGIITSLIPLSGPQVRVILPTCSFASLTRIFTKTNKILCYEKHNAIRREKREPDCKRAVCTWRHSVHCRPAWRLVSLPLTGLFL